MRSLLAVLGLVLLTVGAGMAWPPLAPMVCGAALLRTALVLDAPAREAAE
ncbi:hypothetical protein [Crossiella sp. NPDC003009]